MGLYKKVLSSIYKLPPPTSPCLGGELITKRFPPPYVRGVRGGSCLKLTFCTVPFLFQYFVDNPVLRVEKQPSLDASAPRKKGGNMA